MQKNAEKKRGIVLKTSLAKNAVYKVILNVFNLLVPLFVGPYIAGLISPELYGVYNRVYAEFQVFFIIGAFGIYNYGVREISKVRNDEKRFSSIFTSLFVIGILSNVIVTVFYVIYFMNRSTGIDKYVYLVMIIQMISNMFYIEFVNEAVENYRFIALKTILIRAAYFAAIFAFVRKSTDVVIYSVVVSITVLFNNFASFVYLKRQYKFDFHNVQILCHIFPLFVNLIFVNVELLYSQLDKVLLGAVVSDIAVTEYTLPTNLIGMISTIPLSLITVAIPRLSKYIGENDKENYMNTLHSTCRVYMAILIPMSFGVMVLSKEIMWLYSKDVYTYAYPVLVCAALSRIIYGYQSIMTYLVMYVNAMEKQLTVMLLGGGIINIVLNAVLIGLKRLTALSALLTTMISVLVFITISNQYARKKLKIECGLFTNEIRRYFLVALTFVPVSAIINMLELGYIWNIVLEMIICIGIYGVFMLYTRDPLVEVVLSKLPKKK